MSQNEISEEEKKGLQDAILEVLGKSKSQNELAHKIGISAATLITIKKGEWEKISGEMFNRVQAYFRNDPSWKKPTTWNVKAIHKVCDDCRENKSFKAIAGYTGAGKTTALKQYERQNTQVFYILATTLMTKKSFLNEVQRSMGIHSGVTIEEMCDGIIEKLLGLPIPLLIIDDAGKLNPSVLPLIQIIYDATEGRSGILLAGTEYLYELLERGANRNKLGFRELFRRISYWQPMQAPKINKVKEICVMNGIEDEDVIKYIYQNAHNYGDIRNYVMNAKKAHKELKIPLDRTLLETLAIGKHFYLHAAGR